MTLKIYLRMILMNFIKILNNLKIKLDFLFNFKFIIKINSKINSQNEYYELAINPL